MQKMLRVGYLAAEGKPRHTTDAVRGASLQWCVIHAEVGEGRRLAMREDIRESGGCS